MNVRHHRLRRLRRGRAGHPRWSAASRVPRLRLGRNGGPGRRTRSGSSAPRASSATSSRRAYHEPLHGTVGIGHTRWATHGAPTEANAHPQTDSRGQIAVVHNGILENYGRLRRELLDDGVELQSDTDTELIAQLLGRERGLSRRAGARGAAPARGPVRGGGGSSGRARCRGRLPQRSAVGGRARRGGESWSPPMSPPFSTGPGG